MFYGVRLRREERRKEVDMNLPNSGSDFDPKLAVKCAYYPRPRYWDFRNEGWIYPCLKCRYETPNLSCKRSEILEVGRGELENLKMKIRRLEKEVMKREVILRKKLK